MYLRKSVKVFTKTKWSKYSRKSLEASIVTDDSGTVAEERQRPKDVFIVLARRPPVPKTTTELAGCVCSK